MANARSRINDAMGAPWYSTERWPPTTYGGRSTGLGTYPNPPLFTVDGLFSTSTLSWLYCPLIAMAIGAPPMPFMFQPDLLALHVTYFGAPSRPFVEVVQGIVNVFAAVLGMDGHRAVDVLPQGTDIELIRDLDELRVRVLGSVNPALYWDADVQDLVAEFANRVSGGAFYADIHYLLQALTINPSSIPPF